MRLVASRTLTYLAALGGLFSSHVAIAFTRDQIDTAVRNATDWLYAQESLKGDWEPVAAPILKVGPADLRGRQWGATTAMVVQGLLSADEADRDPRIQAAIRFLGAAQIDGVYASSLRGGIWPQRAASRQTLLFANQDLKSLLSAVCPPGDPNSGFFRWSDAVAPPIASEYQPLLSQSAVSTVTDLEEWGSEVPNRFWQIIDRAWRNAQLPDGSWPAAAPVVPAGAPPPAGDFGSTAAAVAVLEECATNLNDLARVRAIAIAGFAMKS